MIGEQPVDSLVKLQQSHPYSADIHWLSHVDDTDVRLAYSGATVLLFPSLGEGFGWPIAEALASGAPVMTTDQAPMSEVAGDAGFFIPRRPANDETAETWATFAAGKLDAIVNFSKDERKKVVEKGLAQASQFDTKIALDKIEKIYKTIVSGAQPSR
jgi:glycosyltransferase involved in cell wall biosynthesis